MKIGLFACEGKVFKGDKTKMYPNNNFIKYFPEVDEPVEKEFKDFSSCIKVIDLIMHIQKNKRDTKSIWNRCKLYEERNKENNR